MRLIKKSEKLILKKIELEEQDSLFGTTDIPESTLEEEPEVGVEKLVPQYIPQYNPVRDNPVVQSVGKSGWQISDIWRDIRVDDFCGG